MINKILSIIFILSVISCNASSAHTGSFSGRVLDADGKPVIFANVLLFTAADSSLVKSEVTDEKGEFLLTPVVSGNYRIKVMLLGYETFVSAMLSIADN